MFFSLFLDIFRDLTFRIAGAKIISSVLELGRYDIISKLQLIERFTFITINE